MNFKNFSIILALLSFELKAFSIPINEKELNSVEILDSESSTEELSTFEISESEAVNEVLNIVDAVKSSLENVEDSDFDNDCDFDSESDNEETEDLFCRKIKDCKKIKDCLWMKENKEVFEKYNITDEVIDNLFLQYQNETNVEKLQQNFESVNYGMKVDVNGHEMSVNIKGEEHDTTIVLLPASGVPSPVIFYNGFTDVLANDFKVVTIEPFGYGVSDLTDEERTAENIVSEIHECLQELGIDQFYFMGHSIGGMYSLIYDNTYEDEVLGFIGLDNTPNNHNFNDTAHPKNYTTFAKLFDKYHFWGLLPENQKKQFLEVSDIEQQIQNYTEEEKKDLFNIASYRNKNTNIVDEDNYFEDTVAYADNMYFHCPMLMFITDEADFEVPEWSTLHKNMIDNNPEKGLIGKSKVIRFEGIPHIFIHSLKKDAIIDDIKQWIN